MSATGCSWCMVDSNLKTLTRQYCTTQCKCFQGVAGRKSPNSICAGETQRGLFCCSLDVCLFVCLEEFSFAAVSLRMIMGGAVANEGVIFRPHTLKVLIGFLCHVKLGKTDDLLFCFGWRRQ